MWANQHYNAYRTKHQHIKGWSIVIAKSFLIFLHKALRISETDIIYLYQ